jgi:hypothetical protein
MRVWLLEIETNAIAEAEADLVSGVDPCEHVGVSIRAPQDIRDERIEHVLTHRDRRTFDFSDRDLGTSRRQSDGNHFDIGRPQGQ